MTVSLSPVPAIAWLACLSGVAVAALLAVTVAATEKPSEEHVQAMKTLATVAKELPERLAEDDAPALDKLIIAARPAIAVIDGFWRARGPEAAVGHVEAVSKSISEISVAVHLMADGPNPIATEGAQHSIKNLTQACAACHLAHRVTLPDGTYGIK